MLKVWRYLLLYLRRKRTPCSDTTSASTSRSRLFFSDTYTCLYRGPPPRHTVTSAPVPGSRTTAYTCMKIGSQMLQLRRPKCAYPPLFTGKPYWVHEYILTLAICWLIERNDKDCLFCLIFLWIDYLTMFQLILKFYQSSQYLAKLTRHMVWAGSPGPPTVKSSKVMLIFCPGWACTLHVHLNKIHEKSLLSMAKYRSRRLKVLLQAKRRYSAPQCNRNRMVLMVALEFSHNTQSLQCCQLCIHLI